MTLMKVKQVLIENIEKKEQQFAENNSIVL
jgi:hypothetical protein